jgi:multiple sugar transport system permease protein
MSIIDPAQSAETVARSALAMAPRAPRSDRRVWLYVLPVCLVYLSVFVAPLVYTGWTSLHETTYYEIGEFTGLDSFVELFSDPTLASSIGTTLALSAGALAVALPLGLLSAIVLNGLPRFKRFTRALFLLPWLMSQATVGTIWFWFLNPSYGPATAAISGLGFGVTDVFSRPDSALLAMILITAWWSYPIAMLLLLGALQTIPIELRESLKVDGGGVWQEFVNITLPYLRNAILSVVVVLVVLYTQMVTIVLVTTQGGPLRGTETLSMRVFNEVFLRYELSGASASALLLFAVSMLLTLVTLRFRRQEIL